jgi:dienelactone hydrolase
MKNTRKIAWLFFLTGIMAACTPVFSSGVAEVNPEEISAPLAVQSTPTVAPTPPLSLYSLESLANRVYGDGEFNVEYTWERQEEFVRYKVNYSSGDLTIHGFVNIPEGKGPFPVVIALHGYIPASRYETLDYSTRYADSIARKGYIVLHPNMRNFPPSDSDGWKRDYLSGYTIDVLNMLTHVREMAGQPGIFENADLSRIGIWGHSLGGGIALRLVGLVEEIKAAVLYAAVSQRYTDRAAGTNLVDYEGSSAAFSVHHGMDDDVISVERSQRLCIQLEDAGKKVECFYYDDQPHTFYRQGEVDALFIQRTIEFLNLHLKES